MFLPLPAVFKLTSIDSASDSSRRRAAKADVVLICCAFPSGDTPCTSLAYSCMGMSAKWSSNEPCILGIDEAGRGPCLGPMVYSAAFCAKTDQTTLKALGVNDSKQLTKEQRDDFREKLDNADFLASDSIVLHASELSAKMLRPSKYNLNAISHDTALSLVQRALDRGVNVKEVYVDTVGDPAKYAAMFRDSFPSLEKVVVEKKADGTYPIVGAASIVAKTTRDKCVASWVFQEEARAASDRHLGDGEMAEGTVSYDRDYGSGYPSDPKCKGWLSRNMDNLFGYPSFVRFSWGTTKRILDSDAVEVTWFVVPFAGGEIVACSCSCPSSYCNFSLTLPLSFKFICLPGALAGNVMMKMKSLARKLLERSAKTGRLICSSPQLRRREKRVRLLCAA